MRGQQNKVGYFLLTNWHQDSLIINGRTTRSGVRLLSAGHIFGKQFEPALACVFLRLVYSIFHLLRHKIAETISGHLGTADGGQFRMIRYFFSAFHNIGKELANVRILGQTPIGGNFIPKGHASIHRDNYFADPKRDAFQNSLHHIQWPGVQCQAIEGGPAFFLHKWTQSNEMLSYLVHVRENDTLHLF